MRISDAWEDYALIDAGNGQKIERYGDITVQRPEPVALWDNPLEYYTVDSVFENEWRKPFKSTIHYKDLAFHIKSGSTKHTGIFPEQAVNWDWMRQVIQKQKQPLRILNLFGYTGGATIACAHEDKVQEVVHIDALRSLNEWTQSNVQLNNLEDKTIRTITDDVMKFLEREQRRGRTYHGIIMDPPSFGRGPKGERWKIEKTLPTLLDKAVAILDPEACFLVLNTYTTNLSAQTIDPLLAQILSKHGFAANLETEAIGITIQNFDQALPAGLTTRWCNDEDLL